MKRLESDHSFIPGLDERGASIYGPAAATWPLHRKHPPWGSTHDHKVEGLALYLRARRAM